MSIKSMIMNLINNQKVPQQSNIGAANQKGHKTWHQGIKRSDKRNYFFLNINLSFQNPNYCLLWAPKRSYSKVLTLMLWCFQDFEVRYIRLAWLSNQWRIPFGKLDVEEEICIYETYLIEKKSVCCSITLTIHLKILTNYI